MKLSKIPVEINLLTGELSGDKIECKVRTLADMQGVFRDEAARQSMDPNTHIYRTHSYCPVKQGEEGGLFWGTTFLEPGLVGDEYFMIKGHYHSKRKCSEYYLVVGGQGTLLLMDEQRRAYSESMRPGTLHYIPANTAHRVVNTGGSVLVFLACWPSDAGHDYDIITAAGFGARLQKVGGVPTLVDE